MRVCVFGAGAIGGHMAMRLHRAGCTVAVIARGAHLEAITRNGLTLRVGAEEMTARLASSDDARNLGQQDFVVVAVKGPALDQVALGIEPLIGPSTRVVFAMNGIYWWYPQTLDPPADELARRFDPNGNLARIVDLERSIGCVVASAAEVEAPGIVRNSSPKRNRLVLGPATGELQSSDRRLVDALRQGGFDAVPTADLAGEMWAKLSFYVALSPVAALTGGTNRSVLGDPALNRMVATIVAETLAVARAAGSTPALDVEARLDPQGAPDHKPSLLQDLERRRPMEIDSTIGAVRGLARSLDVATPTLDMISTLLEARARSVGLG